MEFLTKLEPRERLLFLILGIVVSLTVILGGIGSFYRYSQKLSTRAEMSSEVLLQLRLLKSQIASLDPEQKRPNKTQVFSKINATLQSYQLKPVSINEKENLKTKTFGVSVRLQSVPMGNLLRFLYYVEYTSRFSLSVSSFNFRRTVAKNELYDVDFLINVGGGP